MSNEPLPAKPNILLLITDQEREVMHWPAGWDEENLPARKRLMAHGLTFRNAHCNSGACSPSRATLLTGLYPAQHGVKNLIFCDDPNDEGQRRTPQLPTSLPNLATVLATAGYHVVLKGKFHLSRPVAYNQAMRRQYWSDADVDHMADRYGFHEWNPPDMSDPMGLNDFGGGAINNDGRYVDGSGTAAGHPMPTDEQVRQSAVHFINNYQGEKPFCLIVSLVNPHDVQAYPGRGIQGVRNRKPIYAQGGYDLRNFQDLPIDLPPTVDEDLSTKPSVQASIRQLIGIGTGHTATRARQRTYARFYAYLCREVDHQIGKVLDALDAKGLTATTLIIRTSDHGELAMAHGRLRQKFYNVYREALNVPLIFSNPRLFPTPQRTDALAGLVDILPTLATFVDLPNRERYLFKGRDLTPILRNPTTAVQDYLHFTYEDDVFAVKGANCIRALIEKEWKYAVYYDPFKGAPIEYELYNLKTDPLETTNLAHAAHFTPDYAAERTRLHNRLTAVMQELGTLPDETRWPSTEEFTPAPTTGKASAAEQIHRGVKTRQWLYTAVFLVMTLNALYQVFFAGADLLATLGGFGVGALLGATLVSRMSKLTWDEERGQIVSSMDFTSVIVLIGYVIFIFVRDNLLERRFVGATLDGVSASVVGGIMLGQLYAMRRTIRQLLEPSAEEQGWSTRFYQAQIDIDAPVEQVWQSFTDFATFPQWNPLLAMVEGEPAPGAQLRVRAVALPGTVTATVTHFEPPFVLQWRDQVPLNLMTPRFGVSVEALADNRTRFTVEESFSGPLVFLLGGQLDRRMAPLYGALCQALKARVEAATNATTNATTN